MACLATVCALRMFIVKTFPLMPWWKFINNFNIVVSKTFGLLLWMWCIITIIISFYTFRGVYVPRVKKYKLKSLLTICNGEFFGGVGCRTALEKKHSILVMIRMTIWIQVFLPLRDMEIVRISRNQLRRRTFGLSEWL